MISHAFIKLGEVGPAGRPRHDGGSEQTADDSLQRKLLHGSDDMGEGGNRQQQVMAPDGLEIKAAALVGWTIDAPVENNPARPSFGEDVYDRDANNHLGPEGQKWHIT